jgi:hypothetical protein
MVTTTVIEFFDLVIDLLITYPDELVIIQVGHQSKNTKYFYEWEEKLKKPFQKKNPKPFV